MSSPTTSGRGGRGRGHRGRGRASVSGKRGGRGARLRKSPDSADIGCEPGDPNNHLLPWVPEGLEAVPDKNILGQSEELLANVTLPDFQRRKLSKCAIVVDRHVHKNGGSSVRDLFLEHERTGEERGLHPADRGAQVLVEVSVVRTKPNLWQRVDEQERRQYVIVAHL